MVDERGMRVLVAMDSFKGSLTSLQAGNALAEGLRRSHVEPPVSKRPWTVTVVPISDGGEGTLAALKGLGEQTEVEVVNAFGEPHTTTILMLESGSALIESALVLGLHQVGVVDETVVERTSSYGLGLAIKEAMRLGAGRVLVTLGGSATTDGGTGMLLALGGRARDADGREIAWKPGRNPLLGAPTHAELPELSVDLEALVDVNNPLTGSRGAAAVFGPQKGLTPTQVRKVDALMAAGGWALDSAWGLDVSSTPGSGAAGGIGAGLMSLGATIRPGFAAIADLVGLERHLQRADLVITGEGRIDSQTLGGKAPMGVAEAASGFGVPTIAVGGSVDLPEDAETPFAAVFSILRKVGPCGGGGTAGPGPLAEAMRPDVARRNLTDLGASLRGVFEAAWEIGRKLS